MQFLLERNCLMTVAAICMFQKLKLLCRNNYILHKTK